MLRNKAVLLAFFQTQQGFHRVKVGLVVLRPHVEQILPLLVLEGDGPHRHRVGVPHNVGLLRAYPGVAQLQKLLEVPPGPLVRINAGIHGLFYAGQGQALHQLVLVHKHNALIPGQQRLQVGPAEHHQPPDGQVFEHKGQVHLSGGPIPLQNGHDHIVGFGPGLFVHFFQIPFFTRKRSPFAYHFHQPMLSSRAA